MNTPHAQPLALDRAVEQLYQPLFRYAAKLAGNATAAADLTPQTFWLAQTGGRAQLRKQLERGALSGTLRPAGNRSNRTELAFGA